MDLNRLEELPLNGHQIIRALNGKTNLMSYEHLNDFDNIDDVLGQYGACVLLYLTKKKFGHWTVLFKRTPDIISVFDSYGIIPDNELMWVSEYKRRILHEEHPHLTFLLYKSPYNIEYNDHQFQEYSGSGHHINTCGRYSVVRLKNRHMDPEEFKDYLLNNPYGYNPDEYVTFLTSNI